MNSRPKVVLLTNIPVPYRKEVYSIINGLDLLVVYCARSEANRRWMEDSLAFNHRFLSGFFLFCGGNQNFIYFNPEVWGVLNEFRPHVVITTSFSPTFLLAFMWSLLHGVIHVCMTDGSVYSESKLTLAHRLIRKLVFRFTRTFIAASQSGRMVYRGYGISDEFIFQSPLCADNQAFSTLDQTRLKSFDVCFSGQMIERKSPLFFVDVCVGIQKRRGTCRVLVLGDGPLRPQMIAALEKNSIEYFDAGFVQPGDLPSFYNSIKLLLFPTKEDSWGVVANESMAAGAPVITTPYAGVANELVIDGVTGYICPLDVHLWIETAVSILDNATLWERLSSASRQQVAWYQYNNAAMGIEEACLKALTISIDP